MNHSIGKVFEDIYFHNRWTHGSGPGSIRQLNTPFLSYLANFLSENDVKSLVDVGCGDFQLFEGFSFGPAAYLGLDVTRSVIARNKRAFEDSQIKFAAMPSDVSDLPAADLYIVKDVLIHLDNETSVKLINAVLQKGKAAIFVDNYSADAKSYNRDIVVGEFRPVDVSLAPFNLEVVECFLYGDAWAYDPRLPKFLARVLRKRVWPGRKHVQLVCGRASASIR